MNNIWMIGFDEDDFSFLVFWGMNQILSYHGREMIEFDFLSVLHRPQLSTPIWKKKKNLTHLVDDYGRSHSLVLERLPVVL